MSGGNYSHNVCNFKIGIMGAGSYGTALAQRFHRNGTDVVLVSNDEKIATEINTQHTHNFALPGIKLSESLRCTTDIEELSDADCIFITVPAGNVVEVCPEVDKFRKPFVLCSKGLEAKSGILLSEAVEQISRNDIVIFSGPSFAIEVAAGLHAGVNVAGKNMELTRRISDKLSANNFVVKAIDDYIGLQLVGVFKNILAVGCGVLCGLNAGRSCTARFIVNGMTEIAKLAEEMGGRRETLLELGGVGDIILTCTSEKSRNMAFGKFCSHGNNSIKNWDGPLAEGALTLKWVPALEEKFATPLPLFHKIYSIVYDGASPEKLLE